MDREIFADPALGYARWVIARYVEILFGQCNNKHDNFLILGNKINIYVSIQNYYTPGV